MLKFLFGGGWWTLWYLYLHVWWVVIGWFAWWLSVIKPGAGPQGGEAAFAFLVMFFLGMTLATGVDALLYGSTRSGGWSWRYLGVPGLAMLGWIALIVAMLWLGNLATVVDSSPLARRLGMVGFLVTAAIGQAANLYALWVYRGR